MSIATVTNPISSPRLDELVSLVTAFDRLPDFNLDRIKAGAIAVCKHDVVVHKHSPRRCVFVDDAKAPQVLFFYPGEAIAVPLDECYADYRMWDSALLTESWVSEGGEMTLKVRAVKEIA